MLYVPGTFLTNIILYRNNHSHINRRGYTKPTERPCNKQFVSEPDCNRCDYTKGQIWLPDSHNCHDYYICEKVDTWAGRWYWTYHHVSCGLLYWDQSRLTCTTVMQPDCEDQDPVTIIPPSTPEGMSVSACTSTVYRPGITTSPVVI